jgi:hypothetical protein
VASMSCSEKKHITACDLFFLWFWGEKVKSWAVTWLWFLPNKGVKCPKKTHTANSFAVWVWEFCVQQGLAAYSTLYKCSCTALRSLHWFPPVTFYVGIFIAR